MSVVKDTLTRRQCGAFFSIECIENYELIRELTSFGKDLIVLSPTYIQQKVKDYVHWMADIKQRFRQSQVKAAVRVNTAMLEFYWSLGRDIVELCAESKWGNGFFNQLCLDLKTAFPNEKGFSVTNLKYMKRWYAFYNERVAIRPQVGDEFDIALASKTGDNQDVEIRQQAVDEKSQQVVGQLEIPENFGSK